MNADLPPPARRGGALAFKTQDGEWITAEPHDPLYSTVTMSATHVWTGTWKPIHTSVLERVESTPPNAPAKGVNLPDGAKNG